MTVYMRVGLVLAVLCWLAAVPRSLGAEHSEGGALQMSSQRAVPDLLTDSPAPARGLSPSPSKFALRSRQVGVDLDALALASGGSPSLRISFFPDASFVAQRDEVSVDYFGNTVWQGHAPDDPTSTVRLVVGGGILTGYAFVAGAVYQIRTEDGVVYLVEQLDQAAFPSD